MNGERPDLPEDVLRRAARVRFLVTDCDGVLTDGSVYYSARGEELKRFLIRDGMGVERLRRCAHVETAIITGENSGTVSRRAAKLGIQDVILGSKDKAAAIRQLATRRGFELEAVAYVGDDVNDLAAMQEVGLACCPADAMQEVVRTAHYVCRLSGGLGAFREVAEVLILAHAVSGSVA